MPFLTVRSKDYIMVNYIEWIKNSLQMLKIVRLRARSTKNNNIISLEKWKFSDTEENCEFQN